MCAIWLVTQCELHYFPQCGLFSSACNGVHTHIPENGFIDLEFEVKDALRVPIIAIIYSQYDKILTWKRSKGKGFDYPPEVEVINNFSVKGSVNEESVNY